MPSAPSENRLFCFGYSFSARALVRRLGHDQWSVAATCRTAEKAAELVAQGIDAAVMSDGAADDKADDDAVRQALAGATHVLVSIPPGEAGDPALAKFGEYLATSDTLRWLAYLSTTGVYGDTGGAWVDEDAPLNAGNARSIRRIEAERGWLDLGRDNDLTVQVFRLAGIYGPGRSAIDQLRAGTARRIVKPGQVFSRIHVDDIANVLAASIARPEAGAIYNVCDNEPAPNPDVVAHAADLLGMEPPPAIAIEDAELSPMAASFYAENRRVRNTRLKSDLGVTLAYPTYREGLSAILAGEG